MEVLKSIGLVILTGFCLILLIKDISGMTPSERKKYGGGRFGSKSVWYLVESEVSEDTSRHASVEG